MTSDVEGRIDALARTVGSLAPSDLPGLAQAHTALEDLEASAKALGRAEAAGRLRGAADRIEQLILEDGKDGPAALEGIARTLREVGGALGAPAPAPPGSNADPRLVADFAVEAGEHLAAAEAALLALESSPGDAEGIAAVFRAFHTIKGVSGFLGLDAIGSLAHEAEGLLDAARKGAIALAGEAFEATLAARDAIAGLVGALEGGPSPAPAELESVRERIAAARSGSPAPPPAAPAPVPVATASPARETLRVDAGRLDRLLDAVGELAISASIVRASLGPQHESLRGLEKLARQIQEEAISLRLVPLEPTFQKLTRLVRETARQLGKEIAFSTRGGETELDRNLVDGIGDPLVHMLRNAIDHGIESDPSARTATGKPAQGRIELRAFHRGGTVHVEIEDDGRGLDTEAILRRARERGLIGPDEMPPRSTVFGLIFEPGFSTARAVTGVSGRGVGMDVVKKHVQALRGQIHIRSEPGRGSVFSLRLPLTLAMMEGMLVRVGSERYLLPIVAIVRSLRPAREDLGTILGRESVLIVDGRRIPLLFVGRVLGTPEAIPDPERAIVVLVEDAGRRVGLVVDDLEGQRSVVLKHLGRAALGIPAFSGGAILPDGSVCLVLDVTGLLDAARAPGIEAVER